MTVAPASRGPSRGPSRATVLVGFAVFGGVLGLVAGSWLGLTFFGIELPDDGAFFAIAASGGAAAGVLLGGVAGAGIGTAGRGPTRGGAWALRLAAGVALASCPLMLELATRWSSVARDEISAAELPWLRSTIVASAVIAAGILLHASFPRPHDTAVRPPGMVARAVSVTGLALGVGILVLIGAGAVYAFDQADDRPRIRALRGTVDDLLDAARRYEERHGVFPRDATVLLATGVRPRAEVDLVIGQRAAGGFCVVVGRDIDRDGVPDAFVAGLTRGRDTTSGLADSCAALRR